MLDLIGTEKQKNYCKLLFRKVVFFCKEDQKIFNNALIEYSGHKSWEIIHFLTKYTQYSMLNLIIDNLPDHFRVYLDREKTNYIDLEVKFGKTQYIYYKKNKRILGVYKFENNENESTKFLTVKQAYEELKEIIF